MRREKYGVRDQSMRDWHRYAMPRDTRAIDLDGVEYCLDCWRILLLREDVMDVGQPDEKKTYVLRTLARRARLKAILVYYRRIPGEPCICDGDDETPGCRHGIERFRVRRVYPYEQRELITMTPDEFVRALVRARQHDCPTPGRHDEWLRKQDSGSTKRRIGTNSTANGSRE